MKLLKKKPQNFYNLPEKKKKDILLRAAKSANKQQQALEAKYLKLRPRNAE